jgi:hypothetical protein
MIRRCWRFGCIRGFEVNGERVWAGANDLSGDQPSFVGMRVLLHGYVGGDAVVKNAEVRTKN